MHLSIRVYLAAISAFHSVVDAYTIFPHPNSKQFLKGLVCLYFTLSRPTSPWDLSIVLQSFTRKPFYPMASCSPHLLAWKTAFLVAIMSARRVGELQVWHHDPLHLMFHPEGVMLFPDVTFLPKVVSAFHHHASIHLLTFFPNP